MIRAALFDFDMTLADSTAGAVECTNYALLKMGLDAAEANAIHRVVGLSLPKMLHALTGVDTAPEAKMFAHCFVERADQCMADLTVVFPEVRAMVRAVRELGVRTAIVSTKFRYRIASILARDQLTEGFDVIVGGEDVTQHKPEPEGLLLALAKLNVAPEEAVYVGDHLVDAEAAQRAGVAFIAVLTGSAVAGDFSGYSAIGILPSVAQLHQVLNGKTHTVEAPS